MENYSAIEAICYVEDDYSLLTTVTCYLVDVIVPANSSEWSPVGDQLIASTQVSLGTRD
jgi:hypothetical protein